MDLIGTWTGFRTNRFSRRRTLATSPRSKRYGPSFAARSARRHRPGRSGVRRRTAAGDGWDAGRPARVRHGWLEDGFLESQRSAVRVSEWRAAARWHPADRRAEVRIPARGRRGPRPPRAGARCRGRRTSTCLPRPDPRMARDRQRHARGAADRGLVLPAVQLIGGVRPAGEGGAPSPSAPPATCAAPTS